MADDHVLRLRLLGTTELPYFDGSVWELFRFIDGNPQTNTRMIDWGFWPWWSLPELRAAFCRPVTGVTHWLDFRLWPESPWAMNLQSVLWLGGCAGAVALLYRRVMGVTVAAGLAALTFAIDDAHATPVGFLANRNALVALFFGLLALLCHDRWRREGWRTGAWLGPLLLATSLFAAEAGVGTVAYLAAYALFLERGGWRRRLGSLVPHVIVLGGWRIAWNVMGYGVRGSDFYVDPLVEPGRFAAAVVERMPVLLMGQWLGVPAELFALWSEEASGGQARVGWLAIVAVVLAGSVVMVPLLKRDRTARFWAAGMLLAVLPVCAAQMMDRLLVFVGVGAFGLLGAFLADTFKSGPARERPGLHAAVKVDHQSRPGWLTRASAVGLVVIHLVIAPLALPFRAAMPMGPNALLDQMFINTPMDDTVATQDVVIVQAPLAVACGYLPILQALNGRAVPRHTRALSPSFSAVRVTRPDERTLVLLPEDGYLKKPLDVLSRGRRHPMSLGQRVELTGMTATIMSLTPDGRPGEVSFRFDVPLEDPSLRWLYWKDGDFVAFSLPEVGESVDLPRPVPRLRR